MNKPSSTAAAERPVKRSSYDYDDLIRCGHGEYFGEANGRMPLPPMLMLDRITLITSDTGKYGKGEIKAELDINPDLWFFGCHFDGDPVMSSSVCSWLPPLRIQYFQ